MLTSHQKSQTEAYLTINEQAYTFHWIDNQGDDYVETYDLNNTYLTTFLITPGMCNTLECTDISNYQTTETIPINN